MSWNGAVIWWLGFIWGKVLNLLGFQGWVMGEFLFNFLPVFALAMALLSWVVFCLYPDKSNEETGNNFGLMILLTAVISSVVTAYFTWEPWKSDSTAAKFGQMGDFFGGMLNPILAFASFIALLYTIKLQSEEMKETRKELMQSRIAQQSLVAQARIEQEAHGRREMYRALLASLTESNDRIKGMLEKPFSKVNPSSMRKLPKRPMDIVMWCFIRKMHPNANYHDLQSSFESDIVNDGALHEFLLEDIRPLLSECRRLKVIASDFEETCQALGIVPDEPVDINFLTNFNHLMIKDAALNLKRARWLSETFDSFTMESFTPKPGSLLDKFGAEDY